MSSKSILKAIKSMEKDLKELRLAFEECDDDEEVCSKKKKIISDRKDKPGNIEKCVKKTDIAKFTKKDLIDWLKSKDIKLKNASDKTKSDIVDLAWKQIKENSENSESDSSTQTESSGDDSD
jgi:hypothetical protein